MIVLDTNVLSEMLRARPEKAVVDWMAAQTPAQVFTTAITEAEIRYGIARLRPSRRRTALAAAVAGIFAEDLNGRVLSFDRDAALAYAEIVAARERAGRPISQFDAQIAAIARARDAEVATRNVRDFADCGVKLVNPWQTK